MAAAWAAASLSAVPALAQAQQSQTFIHINPEQQTALGVHLATVQAAGAAKISLPARVVVPTSQQAVVVAPAAGLVTRLLVTAGDTVKRGQLLAELSSPQIAQLQRQRNESAIQRNLARAQEQRDALLSQEGIIPAARLQSAQARLSAADEML
ncbi:efflux RND transporter periplasmic adaptor subunit, partial [Thiomonas sp.]